MTWNYRIVEQTEENGGSFFGIHETYYDDDKNIVGVSQSSISMWGESIDDLAQQIDMMSTAFDKPLICIEGDLIYEQGKREQARGMTKEIGVGSICETVKASLPATSAGERGVCVAAFTEDEDGDHAYIFLFEGGALEAYNDFRAQNELIVDGIEPSLRNYEYTGGNKVFQDWKTGLFNAAFEPRR